MHKLILVAALFALAGCQLDRMVRIAPIGGSQPDPDRINVWPLFYKNGDQTAVLWPVFDEDENGFALRPIISKEGDDWGVLMPLSFWNTESGNWFAFPAFSWDECYGFEPVFGNFAEFVHVGPAWWGYDHEDAVDSFGLFPLFASTNDLSHVGPVFWSGDDDARTYGVFPLFAFRAGHWGHIGTAFWSPDDGYGLLPLFVVSESWSHIGPFVWGDYEDGGGIFVSPLGGRAWDADGNTTLTNVLGPVYHNWSEGEASETHVLWPIFKRHASPTRSDWAVWPLHERKERFDGESGDTTSIEHSSLAGLVKVRGLDDLDLLRIFGLVSYKTEDGGGRNLADGLTLFGYKDYGEGKTAVHIGTPALFNYSGDDESMQWSSLLGTLHYESTGDDHSKFNFLYYLYRQETSDGVTHRDFFPFFTWDSGEERSKFSFLWRLFNYERDGDDVRGHFLFIPWG